MPRCRTLTQSGIQCKRIQNATTCVQHSRGGFIQLPDRLRLLTGNRTTITRRFADFLNAKNYPVYKLLICKKPVNRLVQTALNVLSFGNFAKTRDDLGYSDVFHYFLVVFLDNPQRDVFIIEKMK
jgi:hypothetical protein